MKEKLIEWADAGDVAAMFNVAEIFHEEGNESKSIEYLKKAADADYIDAMKKMAAIYREGKLIEQDFSKALEYYRIAALHGEEDAMEAMVDMCEQGQGVPVNDEDTLNFVLRLTKKMYNEIYFVDRDFFGRTLNLGTRRHNECTFQTLQAIERRRIQRRIVKIKAKTGK